MSPLPAALPVIPRKLAFFGYLGPFFSIFTDRIQLFLDNIHVKQFKIILCLKKKTY